MATSRGQSFFFIYLELGLKDKSDPSHMKFPGTAKHTFFYSKSHNRFVKHPEQCKVHTFGLFSNLINMSNTQAVAAHTCSC